MTRGPRSWPLITSAYPSQQWQVMRRLGTRNAQADCLPQATVSSSRPLPLKGSRSRDPGSRKRRTMQNDTEGGTGSAGGGGPPALRRGWQKGGEDAGGATARGGDVGKLTYLPHSCRRSNTSQRIASHPGIRREPLLPRLPPLSRHRYAKLPATTATPRPSDGSYL